MATANSRISTSQPAIDPTFELVWNELQHGMDQIFIAKKMPKKEYMLLYTRVYDYCTNVQQQNSHHGMIMTTPQQTRQNRRRPQPVASNFGAYGEHALNNTNGQPQMRGEELYKRMREKLDEHLTNNVIPFIKNESDDIMLQNYVNAWDQFRFSSKVLDGICDYINRNWVRRECQENSGRRAGELQVVVEVYGMCLFAWKDKVFGDLKTRITASILKRIENHREGEQIEKNIISSIVNSYVALGVRAVCADNLQNGPAVGRGTLAAPLQVPPSISPSVNGTGHYPATFAINIGTSRDSERFFTPTLHVYEQELQTPLLAETERYYSTESEQFLQLNSVEEYMRKALVRLDEERTRCRAYLHITTEPRLMRTMENVLIVKHLERFHSEFQNLLHGSKIEDLNRMYQLVSRVENGLEKLYQLVEKHAKEKGLESIANLGRDALEDSVKYVQVILEEHRRCTMLIKEAFSNDVGFKAAIDRALSTFVNKNYATDNTPQGTNKSAEHLARFSDLIMKKGSKMGAAGGGDDPTPGVAANSFGGNSDTIIEQDSEAALNQVLTIFRYLEDKDVFEKFYSRSLAKRLIFGMSESDSLEETMISRLKESCGYDYASKLQRMYTDYTSNKDLNEKFKQFVENLRKSNQNAFEADLADGGVLAVNVEVAEPAIATSNGSGATTEVSDAAISGPPPPPISCQVLVVTSGQWPMQDTQTEFLMPEELDRCIVLFKTFYDKQHNGRKLMWAHTLGRCDLQTNCYKWSYFLTCNLPQTIILLQFNGTATSMTYRQLLDNTKLDDGNAKQSLQILALKAHLLNCINPVPADPPSGGNDGEVTVASSSFPATGILVKSLDDILLDTIIQLNKSYKNKKLRLNLNVMVKGQEKKEQEQTYKGVEGDRSIVVQAAIVRVMKARKTLKHQQLVAETFEQVSRRFKPSVPVVKKAISTLIDREFIKRDDAQNDLYHYVA